MARMPCRYACFTSTHLGDGVGDFDQLRRGIAPGDDDVDVGRPAGDRRDDVADGQPVEVHQVGEFVEDHELVFAGVDDADRLLPSGGGVGTVGGQVVGVPGEPVAEGVPVDAELATDLLLADLPVAGLDELHDRDVPPAGDTSNHHPERGRRLALPVAGVHHDQRLGAPQAVGTGILGGRPVDVGVPLGVRVGVGFARHEWGSVRSDHYDVELSSWQRSSVRIRRCPATVVRWHPCHRPARSPATPTPTSIPRGKGRFAPAPPAVTQLVLHPHWRQFMRSFDRRTVHRTMIGVAVGLALVAAGCGSDSDSSSDPAATGDARRPRQPLDRRRPARARQPARPRSRRPTPVVGCRTGDRRAAHRVAEPDPHRDPVRHRCGRPGRGRRRLLRLSGRGARTAARAVGIRTERRGDRRLRARPRGDRR